MLSRLVPSARTAIDSSLYGLRILPHLRFFRCSTANSWRSHNAAMSANDGSDASQRPKKLICKPDNLRVPQDDEFTLVRSKSVSLFLAGKPRLTSRSRTVAPGDIAPAPSPQATDPSAKSSQEQAAAPPSTTNATTDNQILPTPARAHQFVTNPPLTISQVHPTNPLLQFHAWFKDSRLPPTSAPETCTLATAELPSGRVSARVLYLKELDERGWVVYSNWGSREGKGGQVFGREGAGSDVLGSIPQPGEQEVPGPGNKWGGLTFHWTSVERQVRVEGMLEPLSRAESELYWRTRERGSQVGAWASWQSKVLWSAEPEQLLERQKQKGTSHLQAAHGADVPANIGETDDADGRDLLESKVQEMEAKFAGVEKIPLPPFWGGVRLVPESVEFWQGRQSRLHDRFRYIRVEGAGDQWRLQRLSP